MVEKVIKKSRQIEEYQEEKIRRVLERACQDAGIQEDRKNEIIDIVLDNLNNMLKDRDIVNSYEIREIILSKLDEIEPTVSEAWRNYEETQK